MYTYIQKTHFDSPFNAAMFIENIVKSGGARTFAVIFLHSYICLHFFKTFMYILFCIPVVFPKKFTFYSA